MIKKKILIITQNSEISGGPRIANSIIKNLRCAINFYVFYPKKGSASEELKKYKDVHILYPNKKLKSALSLILYIKNLIKKINPDIIHIHGTRAALWVKSCFMLGAPKKKTIYTLHGIHFIRRNKLKKLIMLNIEKFTNKFIDVLVCVSKNDYNITNKLRLIKNDRIILIRNGINSNHVNRNKDEKFIRKKFGIKNQFIISTICRLHYQKDVQTLIKSIKLLENENLRCLIVGDGPERLKLEVLTNKLKINNKVLFLGEYKNIPKILSATDIFVLSTKWEGLPLTILEAMVAKKPVIGSNVDGVNELIINNKTGLLFELGNSKELAKKILIFIKNKKMRDELSKNAYNLVKKRYSIDHMINDYKTLYLSLN